MGGGAKKTAYILVAICSSMHAVTNIVRDVYSLFRLGFLFLQLYACVSRHYTLDGAVGIELHFVDAYLAVNAWL